MEKSQREYYLNEQMKAIQKELGELYDAPNEIGELEKRIKVAGMPKEAREKANSELSKLKLMVLRSANVPRGTGASLAGRGGRTRMQVSAT